MGAIKKGDIAAMKTIHHTFYADYRKSEPETRFQLVKCAAATKDGLLKEFILYPGSYAHKEKYHGGKPVFLSIGPEYQEAANRLFEKKTYEGPDYASAELLRDAITTA